VRAIVRDRYGSPDVLELREIDKPAVGDDGVLVRVRASSLNSGDLDYLYGRPLIVRLGTGLLKPTRTGVGVDVAGQVEAVGKNVTRFQPGAEVFGDMTQHGFGAFAEYVCAPATAFALKPAGMSFEEAATIPQSAVIALQGLRRPRQIRRGDRVLINGAGGSVGPLAIQIAKQFGAEVTGVDIGAKLDLLRAVGADHVIDYTREPFLRDGQLYDLVLDLVARRSIFQWRRALSPGGRYVMVGGDSGRLLQAALVGPLASIAAGRKLGIMWWWKPFDQSDVATVKELIESGALSPVIDRRYPLSAVAEAFRYMEGASAKGKIVINV
jgi:NADPH:quinone reductase-like Zn-dependent oxidoreductase